MKHTTQNALAALMQKYNNLRNVQGVSFAKAMRACETERQAYLGCIAKEAKAAR